MSGELNALTPREKEVLTYLLGGMSNSEIAAELAIAEKTVKNHIVAIHSKLGFNDRAGAIAWARSHNVQIGWSEWSDSSDVSNLMEMIGAQGLQLLQILAKGATDKEIAIEIGKSVGTVKRRLSALFSVFEVSTREKLLFRASSRGIPLWGHLMDRK